MAVLVGSINLDCLAYEGGKHDQDLMEVLFGAAGPSVRSSDIDKFVKALKYAPALTIDQFGTTGNVKFNYLKEKKMKGIPSKFSDIKYEYVIPRENAKKVDANRHRQFTHEGWEIDFKNSEANKFWKTRKKVMLGTVNTIFGFNKLPVVIKHDIKCEYFCGIIYYVHILGDYMQADNYSKLEYLVPLSGSGNGVYMTSDLKEYIKVLFEDQSHSTDYVELLKGIEKIEKRAKPIQQSTGGVNSDEEFTEYHKCAEDLLELMKKHIPVLLKNEEFFREVFYPDVTR